MGKTARWFRGLLSGKKVRGSDVVLDSKPEKEKKRWAFVRSFRDRDRTVQKAGEERKGSYRDESSCLAYVDGDDHSKHAIAVAAATAAVAEAAVAAAQAAVAVVRLTSGGRGTPAYVSSVRREEWAVVKIQATFRGYLARRALKALKGLVKLQALVRGHIVRKQAAETLRCMQALVRAQARACAGRVQNSDNRHFNKGYQAHPAPATPEKYELSIPSGCNSTKHNRPAVLKRNSSKHKSMDIIDLYNTHVMDQHWLDHSTEDHRELLTKPRGRLDDERSDKILEIDTGKPQFSAKQRINSFHSSHSPLTSDQNSQSVVTFIDSPSKDSTTAQLSVTSPPSVTSQHFFPASSMIGILKGVPPTPSKSDGSCSFFSGYSDHPNYMAYTESSRAKVRSHSAPKQRPELEKSYSTKRAVSVYGFEDLTTSASQRSLKATFMSKAYPGSGRLDRLGMPVHGDGGRI